jgi:hypothetical protein
MFELVPYNDELFHVHCGVGVPSLGPCTQGAVTINAHELDVDRFVDLFTHTLYKNIELIINAPVETYFQLVCGHLIPDVARIVCAYTSDVPPQAAELFGYDYKTLCALIKTKLDAGTSKRTIKRYLKRDPKNMECTIL